MLGPRGGGGEGLAAVECSAVSRDREEARVLGRELLLAGLSQRDPVPERTRLPGYPRPSGPTVQAGAGGFLLGAGSL